MRRTRPIPKIRITIDLDGADRERWKVHALKMCVTLPEMNALSVEESIARAGLSSGDERACFTLGVVPVRR